MAGIVINNIPQGCKGIVVRANGGIEFLNPTKSKKGYHYKEVNDAIGGYAEMVQLPHTHIEGFEGKNLIMLVDEDAALAGKPANDLATNIVGHSLICGDVLITSSNLIK